MKRVLIATDTFKGSVASPAVCEAIKRGLIRAGASSTFHPEAIRLCPISDGGAGLIDAVCAAVPSMQRVHLEGSDTPIMGPLGETLASVDYAVHRGRRELVVEMAQAAGLPLVPEGSRNPLNTTSFGVGQLMHTALEREASDDDAEWTVYLGIGGSSTNDGGLGALQALGLNIYTSQHDGPGEGDAVLHRPLVGRDLQYVTRLEKSPLLERRFRKGCAQIVLICDVDNPFVGPHGATRVYGPQKGASTELILEELEGGMTNVANKMEALTGVDVAAMVGAGGAGGMSGAFACIAGAEWRCGADVVASLVNLPQLVAESDLVITGEGSFDEQTLRHKKTVAKLAELVVQVNYDRPLEGAQQRKVVVVCGRAQFEGGGDWDATKASRRTSGAAATGEDALYDVIGWVCPLTPVPFSAQQAMTHGDSCIEEVVASAAVAWVA